MLLETRAPFLDHRVAEIAWSLPLHFKIKNYGYRSKSKWALKEILKKYVPQEIVGEKEVRFAMPIGFWLRGPLREWAEDLLDSQLISKQGYLDQDIIQRLWHQHLTGKVDNTAMIWSVLMWQAWFNEWILIFKKVIIDYALQ